MPWYVEYAPQRTAPAITTPTVKSKKQPPRQNPSEHREARPRLRPARCKGIKVALEAAPVGPGGLAITGPKFCLRSGPLPQALSILTTIHSVDTSRSFAGVRLQSHDAVSILFHYEKEHEESSKELAFRDFDKGRSCLNTASRQHPDRTFCRPPNKVAASEFAAACLAARRRQASVGYACASGGLSEPRSERCSS